MIKRIVLPCGIGLILIMLLGAKPLPAAQAQAATPEKDENCLGCHENLYYLHDTGKWYCLCSLRARCTYCHRGNPDTVIEDEAHLGLVSNPASGDTADCQNCHPDDFEIRLEKFASLAGIQTAYPDSFAFNTTRPIDNQAPAAVSASFYEFREFTTWQWLGIVFVGILAVGIIYFGYCCWRFDCCNNSNKIKE